MADLNDLKALGDELVPIVKDLYGLIKTRSDATKPDRSAEDAAVKRLKKLVSAATRRTAAPVEQRAAAIVAVRSALTEVLIQAAASPTTLSTTTARTIQTQRNALRNKFGLLLEMDVFEDIAELLSESQIEAIKGQIEQAEEEIATRTQAKETLDTVVKVALAAAKIAAKLA